MSGQRAVRTVTLEVEQAGRRFEVDALTFRSWTGRRWVDGQEHHGPVHEIGSPVLTSGVRACKCRACNGTARWPREIRAFLYYRLPSSPLLRLPPVQLLYRWASRPGRY